MTKKISLLEIEVNKISLKPGDVLLAKVKGPDFKDDAVCEALGQSLRAVFPNNKVGVLYVEDNSIDLTVISEETAEIIKSVEEAKQMIADQHVKNSENSENKACNPTNYCVDCNCGKKAVAEGQNE